MKRIVLLSICLLTIKVAVAQKQDVITTKKVYLQYNTQKDSLLIPVVSNRYPALQIALSDTALFSGDKLEDIVSEYSRCGCGTTSLDYHITFLNSKIISIRLLYEGMGAYPNSYQNWLTLNINKGTPYKLREAYSKAGLAFITQRYKRILLWRIRQAKNETAGVIYLRLLKAAKVLTNSEITRSFVLTKTGILITTDKELPHVVQDMEPERELLFSYNQLNKYIKPNSILKKRY